METEALAPHSNLKKYDFFFVVDLETSGPCPIKNGAIEFQMLVTDKDLKVVDSFYRKVLPPTLHSGTWSKEAQEIHKFTMQECYSHTPNHIFSYELLLFLKPYLGFRNAFVCHATPTKWFKDGETQWGWFDWYFMEWCLRKSKFDNGSEMHWPLYKIFNYEDRISTVQLARDAGYKGNRLNQWAERLNFKLEHHAALSDALCCLEVFKFLYARFM